MTEINGPCGPKGPLGKPPIPYFFEEERVVDVDTGGEKGQKGERHDLIPPSFLTALARHYGLGAMKYEDNNWKKGYKWSLSYAALQRHLHQWRLGNSTYREECWPASRYSYHLVAAAWHCICLWWFEKMGKGTDDVREAPSEHGEMF